MNTLIWDFDSFLRNIKRSPLKIKVQKNQTLITQKEQCLKEEKKQNKNQRHAVLHLVMSLITSCHYSKNTYEFSHHSSFQDDWSIIQMGSRLINHLSLDQSLLLLQLAIWLLLALDKFKPSWSKPKDNTRTFMTQCSTSFEMEMKVWLLWWRFKLMKESSILSTTNFMTQEWCLKIWYLHFKLDSSWR